MSMLYTSRKLIIKIDKVLVVALAIAAIFCLHGITSRYMHPDQMAFISLFNEDGLPFNPGWFEKPPFHAYVNYFLSVLPISVVGSIFDLPSDVTEFIKMIWSKLLTGLMFLGSIWIIYNICGKSFGILSARVIALIFASSAGIVAYSHFLTADIPVMFWMLVAFYFGHNILSTRRTLYYILAGFFTGIATATKYNGLAIGITIVVAHMLACGSIAWRSFVWNLLFDKRLYLAMIMVIVGFIVGNPFSILDYRTFKSDFMYNYMVAPVYEGQTGSSYGKFFLCIVEIVGLPSFIVLLGGSLFSLYSTMSNGHRDIQRATVLLSFSAFQLYYFKFAAFPRLETRFVLPIVPLLMIMSGPFWVALSRRRFLISALIAVVLVYNMICSYMVGQRFLDDPRILSEAWVRENIPPYSSIESDIYSPGWQEVSGVRLRETTAPFVTGRERLFELIFKDNTFINGSGENKKRTDEMVGWFSQEELMKRNPDYVAINSLYYRRFTDPGIRQELYSSMKDYFQGLLAGQYPYEIVFDKESSAMPAWVYPQEIDFLHNRMTILAKKHRDARR